MTKHNRESSQTKQIHVASYSGSRQDSYSNLKKPTTNKLLSGYFAVIRSLYNASKEFKEFLNLLQRSNSVRDKNRRKSMHR